MHNLGLNAWHMPLVVKTPSNSRPGVLNLHAGLLAESPCCRVQVYAMSMFGKDATFTSAAIVAEDLAAKNPVDTESIKHLVHIVFGVSKVCIDDRICSQSEPTSDAHSFALHLALGGISTH